jgi:hypothetical protein
MREVHLPDEPGTVPLREAIAEAREDEEEEPAPPEKGETAPPLSLPGDMPPLSLHDCQQALAWARTELESAQRPVGKLLAAEVARVLRQVVAYLKIMDERHSSLADYEWIFIDQKKVSGTTIDEDRFDDFEVSNVSAVSLHAQFGDVRVHGVTIYDDRGLAAGEYHLAPPLVLRADVPRREVFHLYFPVRLREVVVRYEAVDSRSSPRVDAHAGITSNREFLKQAQYYLRRAIAALENDDWEAATTLISSTARRIAKFQARR